MRKIFIMTKIPTSLYSEATPNPRVMKFTANRMLVDQNIYECEFSCWGHDAFSDALEYPSSSEHEEIAYSQKM